jgi:DNA-binding NtrC family response regulator
MKKPVKRSDKHVFVIESDDQRRLEIQDALGHQKTWKLSFFVSPESCLSNVSLTPMVVFLDIEHFSTQSSDNKAIEVINSLKSKWDEVAVIIFCDSEKEHKAADALKAGALDYIVLNKHQFARMESELTWIEQFLDQKAEDKKQKLFLLYLTLGMVIFVITMIVLDYLGYIREGTQPDILIGD